jgi:hypothetical protein
VSLAHGSVVPTLLSDRRAYGSENLRPLQQKDFCNTSANRRHRAAGALLSHLEHVHGETIGVNLAIHVGPKAIHLIALDTFDGHQWSS